MTTNRLGVDYFEHERLSLQQRIQSLRNDVAYDYATRVALLAQAQDQLDLAFDPGSPGNRDGEATRVVLDAFLPRASRPGRGGECA